jgi:hypothetical protein
LIKDAESNERVVFKVIPPSANAPSKASPFNNNKPTSGKNQPYEPEV